MQYVGFCYTTMRVNHKYVCVCVCVCVCVYPLPLQVPMENSVKIPLQKLGIQLQYGPSIPLLGIYPEKTRIQKDRRTLMFTAALKVDFNK